jgi:hypothetical protein
MANHFPPVPADLQVAGVQYFILISDSGTITAASPASLAGVQTIVGMAGWPNLAVPLGFNFETPGDPGGFDQDTVETLVKQIATQLCQLVAGVTGETLAEVQALTRITANWAYAGQTVSVGVPAAVPYP